MLYTKDLIKLKDNTTFYLAYTKQCIGYNETFYKKVIFHIISKSHNNEFGKNVYVYNGRLISFTDQDDHCVAQIYFYDDKQEYEKLKIRFGDTYGELFNDEEECQRYCRRKNSEENINNIKHIINVLTSKVKLMESEFSCFKNDSPFHSFVDEDYIYNFYGKETK